VLLVEQAANGSSAEARRREPLAHRVGKPNVFGTHARSRYWVQSKADLHPLRGGSRGRRSKRHSRRPDRVHRTTSRRGGALPRSGPGVMERTACSRTQRRLVEAARAAGATIVHAPITFAPGYGELSEHPYGILKGVVDSTAFVKASGVRRSSMRSRRKRAMWWRGQRGLDTFATTTSTSSCAPAASRRSRSGLPENCCVGSTMRTATRRATR